MLIQMRLSIALIIQIKVFSLVSAGNVNSVTDLDTFQAAAKRVERSVVESSQSECIQPPTTPDQKYHILVYVPHIYERTVAKPGQRVPEGTILVSRCNEGYASYDNYLDEYEDFYDHHSDCKNSSWQPPVRKCVKTCGRASSTLSLIANGNRERRGGAPWHLAIYSAQWSLQAPILICGGTLINRDLAISAAHCFYNEVSNQKMNISFFYAIVGKATADYNKPDYPTTKTYTLKNIYFPDDITFEGALANYAGNIAILQLSEKVTLSRDVLPACLDWNKYSRFNPGENVKGKLSGFGEKEDGTMPSELLTADLPYISYGECKNKVMKDFRYSFSTDKFCAGSVKGAGARKGDSGGGLLFIDKETELYYLRGVVSNKDLSDSSIATFTDVAQYISWILNITQVIKRENLRSSKPVRKRPPPIHGMWRTSNRRNMRPSLIEDENSKLIGSVVPS